MATKFVTGPMRSRLKKALGQKPVLAAVAYVTDVQGLPLGKGDTVVCNAESGSTDPEALRALLKLGVEVFSKRGLHAKVVVAGKRVIIGSANWSQNSESSLVEASVDTTDPSLVEAARAFISAQVDGSTPVDEPFIRAMPPLKAGGGTGGAKAPRREQPKSWLLDTYQVDRRRSFQKKVSREIERLQETLNAVELDWIWWPSGHHAGEQLKVGDRVVQVWHPGGGAHKKVYPPVQIVQATDDGEDLFVITANALDHEDRAISWRNFRRLAADAAGLSAGELVDEANITLEASTKLLRAWPVPE